MLKILRITTDTIPSFLCCCIVDLHPRMAPIVPQLLGSCNLSDVRDVVFTAKDLDQLRLVVADVSLHNVHTRTQQALERVHVQNCTVNDDRELKSEERH